eukprot:10293707-Heterocapsa_arctica.AAC.1
MGDQAPLRGFGYLLATIRRPCLLSGHLLAAERSRVWARISEGDLELSIDHPLAYTTSVASLSY